MRIALITKPGHESTGVGRYAAQLGVALCTLGHEALIVHPFTPVPALVVRGVKGLLGWDLAAFFENYPLWARYPRADIYHFTSQNLATLLICCPPPGRTVVTVHDIIPWIVRNDPALRVYQHPLAAWFDRLALAGLRRADALLADSEFTRQSLHKADVPSTESYVVWLGVASGGPG